MKLSDVSRILMIDAYLGDVKGKIYRTTIKLAMLYGSKYWAIKKST